MPIIARRMRLFTRKGDLIEEHTLTYLADLAADNPLASPQAASWPCRPRRAEGAELAHRGQWRGEKYRNRCVPTRRG